MITIEEMKKMTESEIPKEAPKPKYEIGYKVKTKKGIVITIDHIVWVGNGYVYIGEKLDMKKYSMGEECIIEQIKQSEGLVNL